MEGMVTKERWNPQRLNPKGKYLGSGIKTLAKEKRNDADRRVQFWLIIFQKKGFAQSDLNLKNNFKNKMLN